MSDARTAGGGCFCGNIRFEIEKGHYRVLNCHCTMCRRCHAAPFVTWLVVPVSRYRLTKGEPARLDSSTDAHRGFCRDCGTPVYCVSSKHPDYIDIPTGCLDAPEPYPPTKDIYTDTRLEWVSAVTLA